MSSTEQVKWLALNPTATVPNNAACPVALYPNAVPISGDDPALAFEALFDQNGWPSAWRNGVFSFAHFHTTAHEVLGVYQGHASVQLGGDTGPVVDIGPGDVLVIPAGVCHKKLACDGQLGVTAAYPVDQHPDQCQPDATRIHEFVAAVNRVAKPSQDPLHGAQGPLIDTWR